MFGTAVDAHVHQAQNGVCLCKVVQTRFLEFEYRNEMYLFTIFTFVDHILTILYHVQLNNSLL